MIKVWVNKTIFKYYFFLFTHFNLKSAYCGFFTWFTEVFCIMKQQVYQRVVHYQFLYLLTLQNFYIRFQYYWRLRCSSYKYLLWWTIMVWNLLGYANIWLVSNQLMASSDLDFIISSKLVISLEAACIVLSSTKLARLAFFMNKN